MADLKAYFHKIKQLEEVISEPFTVVASVETSDGGKEGVLTEVTRYQAAKLVADGKARFASEEELERFRGKKKREVAEQEKKARAEAMRVTLLTNVLLKDQSGSEDEAV